MRLQKLWAAFAGVLLLVLPAMTVDASQSRSLLGFDSPSASAVAIGSPHLSASTVTPPPVPADIQVPSGNRAYLVGHAVGTQNYICLPSADSSTGVAYTLFTPQATLFDDEGEQISTHYFSPNPSENGTVRATWEDSRDTSKVWAQVKPGDSSTDPAYVAPGAIPWLLLTVEGTQDGPTEGDRLSSTSYIQRLNTRGGQAPSTGCATSTDVGDRAYVPYSADYYFFKPTGGPGN